MAADPQKNRRRAEDQMAIFRQAHSVQFFLSLLQRIYTEKNAQLTNKKKGGGGLNNNERKKGSCDTSGMLFCWPISTNICTRRIKIHNAKKVRDFLRHRRSYWSTRRAFFTWK
jgi:hypothetical protein